MTKSALATYRMSLEAKRNELAPKLRNRQTIAVETLPDIMDQTKAEDERNLAVEEMNLATQQYALVAEALERIDKGTYGVCMTCEEEISLRRLNAVPWTPHCVMCGERAEKDSVRSQRVSSGRPQPVINTTAKWPLTKPVVASVGEISLFERIELARKHVGLYPAQIHEMQMKDKREA